MEELLSLLKETAVFMLVAQMILHFGPGKKYEKYGKMTMALVVLSLFAVPLFSLGGKQQEGDFWGRLDELEAENRVFTQKLEQLDGSREGFVQTGLLLSVEEKLSKEALRAKVSVEEVKIREGVLVILVRACQPEEKGGKKGEAAVEKVEIKPVAVGSQKEEKTDDSCAGAAVFRGKRRADLEERFGMALQMEAEGVEVIEIE